MKSNSKASKRDLLFKVFMIPNLSFEWEAEFGINLTPFWALNKVKRFSKTTKKKNV